MSGENAPPSSDHRRGPTTERLVLRAWEPSDAADFFALNSHPDVLRYTGEPPIESEDQARAFIEAYPDWDRYGFGRWACVLRSGDPVSKPEARSEATPNEAGWPRFTRGRDPVSKPEARSEATPNEAGWPRFTRGRDPVVGFCGFKRLPELDGEIDLGYRFLPRYWGLGLATEASRACLEYGRTQMGLDRVIGLVMPENGPSVRVLEKLGFQHEGELDYFGDRCLRYAKHLASE